MHVAQFPMRTTPVGRRRVNQLDNGSSLVVIKSSLLLIDSIVADSEVLLTLSLKSCSTDTIRGVVALTVGKPAMVRAQAGRLHASISINFRQRGRAQDMRLPIPPFQIGRAPRHEHVPSLGKTNFVHVATVRF